MAQYASQHFCGGVQSLTPVLADQLPVMAQILHIHLWASLAWRMWLLWVPASEYTTWFLTKHFLTTSQYWVSFPEGLSAPWKSGHVPLCFQPWDCTLWNQIANYNILLELGQNCFWWVQLNLLIDFSVLTCFQILSTHRSLMALHTPWAGMVFIKPITAPTLSQLAWTAFPQGKEAAALRLDLSRSMYSWQLYPFNVALLGLY